METAPDRDQLLRIARNLLGGWYADAEQDATIELGQRRQRPNVTRFVSVFSLAGHTHMLIDAAIQSLVDRQDLLALPHLRLAYESALTAAWMAQNSESPLALHNNEIVARDALKRTIGESKQFAERVAEFPTLDGKIEDVSSDAQAKHFWRLCEDFAPDGKTLYLLYRILSKHSHPTGFVIDRFVRMDVFGDVKALGRRPLPNDDNPDFWYFIAVLCLVYAGRAVDHIDPTRSRREELRAAARAVGLPPELKLTPEAQQRIARAEQSRRRATWKGRRRRGRP